MNRLGNIRNRKQTLKAFKELDAFPKVPENYQVTSATGGSVSLLSFIFIAVLVLSEFWYYRAIETKYTYEVDTDVDSKLQLNVDLTIAMKCDDIDADVLDLSGSTIQLGEGVKLESTYFELTEEQKIWLELFKGFHFFLEGYRSVGEMEGFKAGMPTYMPKRKDKEGEENKPHDACRVYGTFEINKVAGNFHITAGKSIHHPRGHAHLSSMVPQEALNFSHRIDMLSFGPRLPGYVHPLDGEFQVTEKNRQMYQYYIKIVPTTIKNLGEEEIKTNQYSVTQRIREISHDRGSHGIAGVFFKYDMSSIMVRVKHQHRSIAAFLVRLCGIVGGIFATSGMLHNFVGFLFDVALCQLGYKKNKKESPDTSQVAPPSPSVVHDQANGPQHVPSPSPQHVPPSPGLTSNPEGLVDSVEFAPVASDPSLPLLQENTNHASA